MENIKNVEELRNLIVSSRGGIQVRLGDVGDDKTRKKLRRKWLV
jgi:HAE1 family hydrophobic/amphiphilic exporter-1